MILLGNPGQQELAAEPMQIASSTLTPSALGTATSAKAISSREKSQLRKKLSAEEHRVWALDHPEEENYMRDPY